MRRLGKRFSDKYNFKRLLQTTPNLSKLYNEHEDAVNSIKPIKHVQLISREELRAYDPESEVDINAACSLEIYGPGSGKWPRRVKYAEQILDVNYHGYSAWVVRIWPSNPNIAGARATVEILQYTNPCITLYYPTQLDAPKDHRAIYNPNQLARLDENEFFSYFLAGENRDRPTDLRVCSIIPSGGDIHNSTFYDREIAYLYAESLQVQLDNRQWSKF